MVGRIDKKFDYTIWLIPEMNFTCRGTIEKVTVVGKRQEGPNPMQLQIWRPVEDITEHYHRVNNISLSPAICMSLKDIFRDVCIYECKPNDIMQVLPGDILGIELPHRHDVNFELYSIKSRVTSYTFERDKSTTTLDLNDRIETTMTKPLIRPKINSNLGIHAWLVL